MSNPKQLWLHVQTQLPDYIRGDPAYAQLLKFLELYWEWAQLEGSNNPVELIANAEANKTIDATIDAFVTYFAQTYLDDFPLIYDPAEASPTVKAHKRAQICRLIKHADELYVSKGMEDSFRTVFRVLYDEEIDLFYPKTVILKPSDGHWREDITVKITIDSGDINAFDLEYGSASVVESVDAAGTILTGGRGTIESIVAVNTYHELYFTPGSLVNITKEYQTTSGKTAPFSPGNKVQLTMGSTSVVGTILPVVSVTSVADAVGGHFVGDVITAGSSMPVLDTNTKLVVKSVTANGTIKAFNVVQSGWDLTPDQTILYDAALNVVGSCTVGGLTYYPGAYKTVEGVNPGFLSDQIKVRGPLSIKSLPYGHTPDEYYQEFSYVIKSAVNPDEWEPTIRALLHPAGYQVFANVQFQPLSTGGSDLLGLYRYNQDNVNDLDAYSDYKYHVVNVLPFSTADVVFTDSKAPTPLGPTLQSLNRFMYTFPAYAGGNQPYGAQIPSSVSATPALSLVAWHSSSVGTTPNSVFANLIVGNFFAGNAPKVKSNVMPQPYVIVS